MRFLVALVAFLLIVPVVIAADLPGDRPLDLYLLIGQSNMAGRGKIEPQDRVPNPHIWKLDKEDRWVPGVDPLHFDKPTIAGVGPGSSFARVLAEKYPNRFIGLIPSAVGGTRIDQWKPGSALYNEAVRRTKVAQGHGTLKGILWHQGESDSVAARVPTYLAHLKEIVKSIIRIMVTPLYWILVTCIAAAGAAWTFAADGKPAPPRPDPALAIARVELADGSKWTLGDDGLGRPFAVRVHLENQLDRAIKIWDPSRNEGSACTRIVLTAASGVRTTLTSPGAPQMGAPSAVVIEAAGTRVIELDLLRLIGDRSLAPGQYVLEVLYESSLPSAGPTSGVWTGSLQSRPLTIEIVRPARA